MMDVYIHKTAIVETKEIGRGCRVWAYSHIMTGAKIGDSCNIGEHCFIESEVSVGNGVVIKNGNMLWQGVTIEDNVFIGPGVIFTNDLYPRSRNLSSASDRYHNDKDWLVPTVVNKGASLGAGAIIIAGVTIGKYAMVGAGTVVTKDIAHHSLVKGNPMEICGWVCKCGYPLRFVDQLAECNTCKLIWRKRDNHIAAIESTG